MKWYYRDGKEQFGPLSQEDLYKLIADNKLNINTPVWQEGWPDWKKLGDPNLLEVDSDANGTKKSSDPNKPSKVNGIASTIVNASQRHAKVLISDLKQMDWKREILPIDSSNLGTLMKDSVFWFVVLLGTIPLLIGTINGANNQLTAFALFFATIWGVLFHRFIIKSTSHVKWLVGALFFTGIVGINLLLWLYQFMPEAYMEMVKSDNAIVRLLGYVLFVGVWEEFCKLLPVLIYIAWKHKSVNPIVMIEIGIFSGLGFAAFENVSYGYSSVYNSYLLANRYGEAGLVAGVQGAMVTTMLRSLSLVFCHAVWSGTFAYFAAVAVVTRKRVGALFLVGMAVSAVLHGVYDWFAGMQPTVSALLAGFSFALFYGYLSKVKRVEDEINTGTQNDVSHSPDCP